jgi:hypothetical protein
MKEFRTVRIHEAMTGIFMEKSFEKVAKLLN